VNLACRRSDSSGSSPCITMRRPITFKIRTNILVGTDPARMRAAIDGCLIVRSAEARSLRSGTATPPNESSKLCSKMSLAQRTSKAQPAHI
jgi:hypothetical protein